MSFLVEGILSFVLGWVLLPVVWVVALPVVALTAMFSSQPYAVAVRRQHHQVTGFWRSWGLVTFP